ncbi:RNA polymerase recycling motor HelD [Paenisporosarcina sp. NPDC076898]|uniref:RNA polymerase recycling motor HelD n=1 Tax=unclassified Paenisporosarcina TaxID=2642018 RepID=UPI003D01F1D4
MKLEPKQEQQRLDHVMDVITNEIQKLDGDTSRRKKEVINIRKHFWEEVKVSTDSFDDYLETIIGLRQEAEALAVSQSLHRHTSKRLATLHRMQEIPYFGRIDFLEDGTSSSEKIYIGISTLKDGSGDDFLIYDWRAPISSVYYDYQPGPAKYTIPGDIVEGTLEKKWQYIIRGGNIETILDTTLTIGDEILQQVLGKGTDKQMHSIVATIQQEQNQIVRHDHGKLLIVHGAAGSGKTSVALQRIAYLLYHYRESLTSDQIILFSPNSMFNSYVANVLPELGEINMHQVTFQQYLHQRLDQQFQVENPFDQLEYVYTKTKDPSYHIRLASIEWKASTDFFDAINTYHRSLESAGMCFQDLRFRRELMVSAKQMEEWFYEHHTSLRLLNRIEKLRDWLIKKIAEVAKMEWQKPWVQEKMDLLSDEAYHKAHRYLAKKHGYEREAMADYDMSPKELAQLIVRQQLNTLRKRVRAFHFVDFNQLYRQLFEDPTSMRRFSSHELPLEWPSICERTCGELDKGNLLYEDATPYVYLKELILGFQANRSIKQVVIDEAQDYSPFQFGFIKGLFPAARMTVLGDFNQAIFAHARQMNDFQSLLDLYGPDEATVIYLARSYRSTKPIVDFTRKLIPNGNQIIPFERDGESPRLERVDSAEELHQHIIKKVEQLQECGYQSIAIICKSVEESGYAYEGLSTIPELKLMTTGSMEYEQGVVVIPSYLSKGIEFEAVIVYDASTHVYGDESLRRVFYTVCTRAMHHLQLYSLGEPTPFL